MSLTDFRVNNVLGVSWNYLSVLASNILTPTLRGVTILDMTTLTRKPATVPADTLAARLLLLRHELHWTQREAAAATGVPFGVWQGMESGRETRGLDRHVIAIASQSGYDRDWLMWGGTLASPDNDRYRVAA